MDTPNTVPILGAIMSMDTAISFFDHFNSLSQDQRNDVFPYIKDKLHYLI